MALARGAKLALLGIERQVEGQFDVIVGSVGHHGNNRVARLREIGRALDTSAKRSTDAVHACHILGKVGHHIAALGDVARSTGTVLAVAHHGVVALGGIVNPGVETAQHAGVDGAVEVEEVLREVKVAAIGLPLIPVNQVFRHPDFLALRGQVLVSRADAAVLVAAVDVEALEHVALVQGVDVVVGTAYRLGSHHLAANLAAVGLHKVSHLAGRPQTAGIRGGPVGLVLDGDGVELHAVLPQVLHVFLQVLGVVGPVLFLQPALFAVARLGVARIVGLPLLGLSPRRGKDNQSHLLGLLRRCQRLAPCILADRDIQAHDVTAHGARTAPHLFDLCRGHVVVGELWRADESAEACDVLILGLSVKTYRSLLPMHQRA